MTRPRCSMRATAAVYSLPRLACSNLCINGDGQTSGGEAGAEDDVGEPTDRCIVVAVSGEQMARRCEERHVEWLAQRNDERIRIAIENLRNRTGLRGMQMRAAREHQRAAFAPCERYK